MTRNDKEWVVEMRHWNEVKNDRAILPSCAAKPYGVRCIWPRSPL